MILISENFGVAQVIACEDIREELNNKHSLMGVYLGDIAVSEFPARLRIGYFIVLQVSDAGAHELLFRFSFGGKSLGEIKGNLSTDGAGIGLLVVNPMPLKFPRAGRFKLEIHAHDDTWIAIDDRMIERGRRTLSSIGDVEPVSSSPSTPLPPS